MVVQFFVGVGADVATGEHAFDFLQEGRVHRHHVFEVTVDCAILHHQDFAVAFNDAGLNFADLLIAQDFNRDFTGHDFVADLGNTLRAQRIGGTGPAKWRLLFFPGLQQGLLGPSRGERRVLVDCIHTAENAPSYVGRYGYGLLCIFNGVCHWGSGISWTAKAYLDFASM